MSCCKWAVLSCCGSCLLRSTSETELCWAQHLGWQPVNRWLAYSSRLPLVYVTSLHVHASSTPKCQVQEASCAPRPLAAQLACCEVAAPCSAALVAGREVSGDSRQQCEREVQVPHAKARTSRVNKAACKAGTLNQNGKNNTQCMWHDFIEQAHMLSVRIV
jgi:hypothetical protein